MEVPLERFKVDNRHKWLYSVVPAFPVPEQFFAGGIYLAGFCPACRQAFTVRLQDDGAIGEVVMGTLDVPVEGCEPV